MNVTHHLLLSSNFDWKTHYIWCSCAICAHFPIRLLNLSRCMPSNCYFFDRTLTSVCAVTKRESDRISQTYYMMQYDTHLFSFVTEVAFRMRARIIAFVYYGFPSLCQMSCVNERDERKRNENGNSNCGQINFECIFGILLPSLGMHHRRSTRRKERDELWIWTKYCYNTYGSTIQLITHSGASKPNLLRIHWDQCFIERRFIYCPNFISILTDLGYSVEFIVPEIRFYVDDGDDGIRRPDFFEHGNTIRYDRTNRRRSKKKLS